MDKFELAINEFSENPSARVPVCLCLDVSSSMDGAPISELNDGIGQFFSEVRGDKLAKYAADICIVTFGDEVERIVDFCDVQKQVVPQLVASGTTPMGEAVCMALDALEERKHVYQTVATDYYQPWLVLMTDGQPTDDISEAARRVSAMVNTRKLTVIPVGIGNNADFNVLAAFSPKEAPRKLKGLAFKEFFAWLSKSMITTSGTNVGNTVPPLPEKDWTA